MQLFYIDESGTSLGDRRSPYFVLAAVGFPVSEWRTVDRRMTTLKRSLIGWAKPEDFEIKGRELRRGEKFFKGLSWPERVAAIHAVAQLIAEAPCRIFVVQVDKRELPEYVSSDDQLYRLAFSRLLDAIDAVLEEASQPGMLLLDMRSDLHSSVQDRRIIDAYRDWLGTRMGETALAELPWFGFSAFYAGLQVADFVAYLVDFASNEEQDGRGALSLRLLSIASDRKCSLCASRKMLDPRLLLPWVRRVEIDRRETSQPHYESPYSPGHLV